MGCFNLITEDDLEQMEATMAPQGGLTSGMASLADTAHSALSNITSANALSMDTKAAILPAFRAVLSITSDPLGLTAPAPNHYGPRATALIGNLAHQTKGEAFAYELLGTAALIQSEAKDVTGRGPCLCIRPGDRVDFGIKHQANYNSGNAILGGQTSRSTVESDLLIQRGTDVVGVDFKHSSTGIYGKTPDLANELKGIVTALKTGEITHFAFATNGAFAQAFKDAVKEANLQSLERDGRAEDQHYLTRAETEAAAREPLDSILLYENVTFEH